MTDLKNLSISGVSVYFSLLTTVVSSPSSQSVVQTSEIEPGTPSPCKQLTTAEHLGNFIFISPCLELLKGSKEKMFTFGFGWESLLSLNVTAAWSASLSLSSAAELLLVNVFTLRFGNHGPHDNIVWPQSDSVWQKGKYRARL